MMELWLFFWFKEERSDFITWVQCSDAWQQRPFGQHIKLTKTVFQLERREREAEQMHSLQVSSNSVEFDLSLTK